MRRQTKPQGLASRWPVRPMDIDPFQLPVKFAVPVNSVSGKLFRAQDKVEIENGSVTVEREVMGARSVREKVSLEDFSGVAIRAELIGENEDVFAVSVNLHHEDPELCIPFYIAFDIDEVNARWQSWGRTLGLPLLLPTPGGTWCEPFERIGKLVVKPALMRHPRKMLQHRRSCISAFREGGERKRMPVVSGAEILARN